MHFADFIGVPMDEIFNQMAKVRYMFGGQAKVPLVLRAPDGSAGGGAAQHSQCVESWFAHIPGIKVVAPSNPYDAKMVLKAAIECDDPVLYFENKILYKEKGEVPEIGEEEPYTLGKARVEREGKDVTIVSYSIGMKNARGAADLLAKEGIEAEVIDLITLSPWDKGDRAEQCEEDPPPLHRPRGCQAGRLRRGDLRHRRGGGHGVSGCPHPAVRRSLLPDPLRSHPGEDGESGSGGPGKGHQGHVLMPVEKEIFKYGN